MNAPAERERDIFFGLADASSVEDLVRLITSQIRSGSFAPGTRLPTIRSISDTGRLSFRAVSSAWRLLQEQGFIETRRRGGSFVTDPATPLTSRRGDSRDRPALIDLTQLSSDRTLLPELRDALESALTDPALHSSSRDRITPRLRAAAEKSWPFPASSFLSSGSGAEAVLLSVVGSTRAGDVVAVDEPTNPGLLQRLRAAERIPIGVEVDGQGPVAASLQAAFAAGARVYVFQPHAPFAFAGHPTAARVEELAKILAPLDALVIEDDSVGPLARQTAPTFGRMLPNRVVHVRTYCRSYGADLRASVIGGPEDTLSRIAEARSFGVAVTSRILQDALATLIQDRRAAQTVATAARTYARRRDQLAAELAERGVTSMHSDEGQFLWVPVPDEARTILQLAAGGIVLAAGATSFVNPPAQGYLRIVTLGLSSSPLEIRRIATAIAEATSGSRIEPYD